VLNLVAAFPVMGTLLAVGLMMLPAVAARFWARDITSMAVVSVGVGIVSAYVGLAAAAALNAKPGPAVILVAGGIYVGSILFGRVGGVVWRAFPGRHLEA